MVNYYVIIPPVIRNAIKRAHHTLITTDALYQSYWEATTDADAVEGELWVDTVQAARLLRDRVDELRTVDWATIADALIGITQREDRREAAFQASVEAEAQRWKW